MPTVTWNNIPMVAQSGGFSISRSVGLDGNAGVIKTPMKHFEFIRANPSLKWTYKPVSPQPSSKSEQTITRDEARLIEEQGRIPGPLGQLPIKARIPDGDIIDVVGDIVMDGGNGDIITIPDVYLAPEGITEDTPTEDEGNGPIVSIRLVTLPFWWSKRGVVPAHWWNILSRDGRHFEVGSYDIETGQPWTLKNRLTFLLSLLPGGPKLGYLPEDLINVNPIGYECNGADLASAQILELSERYSLIPVWDLVPAGQVSFWRDNEGAIGEGKDNSSPILRDCVADALRNISYTYPPRALKIVCAPTVREVSVSLEAVGVSRKVGDEGGEIVGIEEAANSWGLTIDQLASWTLQKAGNKSRLPGLFIEEMLEIEGWAFKWYKIPKDTGDKYLPMQENVSLDTEGRRLPIQVIAGGYWEYDVDIDNTNPKIPGKRPGKWDEEVFVGKSADERWAKRNQDMLAYYEKEIPGITNWLKDNGQTITSRTPRLAYILSYKFREYLKSTGRTLDDPGIRLLLDFIFRKPSDDPEDNELTYSDLFKDFSAIKLFEITGQSWSEVLNEEFVDRMQNILPVHIRNRLASYIGVPRDKNFNSSVEAIKIIQGGFSDAEKEQFKNVKSILVYQKYSMQIAAIATYLDLLYKGLPPSMTLFYNDENDYSFLRHGSNSSLYGTNIWEDIEDEIEFRVNAVEAAEKDILDSIDAELKVLDELEAKYFSTVICRSKNFRAREMARLNIIASKERLRNLSASLELLRSGRRPRVATGEDRDLSYVPLPLPRFVNHLPITVDASEYSIDVETGLIKFQHPRGLLLDLFVNHIEESRMTPAPVTVFFGAEDKPNLTLPTPKLGSNKDRYQYIAVWDDGIIKEVTELEDGIHATPVYRGDLRLMVSLLGNDNSKLLHQELRDQARSMLMKLGQVKGLDLTMASFRQINCNGLVKSVTWSSDGTNSITTMSAGPDRDDAGLSSKKIDRIYGDIWYPSSKQPMPVWGARRWLPGRWSPGSLPGVDVNRRDSR